MKNRNSRRGAKRAERQVEIAGKRPFHRVAKLQKLLWKLGPWSGRTRRQG